MMLFSNKTYDTLKWIIGIFLPALGALYAALAGLWGFPYPEAVCGTISAVTVFLGSLVGVSTRNYNKLETADDEEEEPEG